MRAGNRLGAQAQALQTEERLYHQAVLPRFPLDAIRVCWSIPLKSHKIHTRYLTGRGIAWRHHYVYLNLFVGQNDN